MVNAMQFEKATQIAKSIENGYWRSEALVQIVIAMLGEGVKEGKPFGSYRSS
ncbi:MAG: hypothetical protein ACUVSC_13495 [Candidatus Fervidibacter sp.]|uniref:hypothetical protein n=1 Tax=Candidatus Fervidibacter sp. TaxID=3100871 RepID=UPI00404B169E